MNDAAIFSMDLSVIVESITCPITGDIMTDPVQGNDGQTYERSAIIRALSIKLESPITRAHMTESDLKVNASIRFLCDKYHEGAFGESTNMATTPPKIFADKINIIHTISKNSDNKMMLTFDVDPASMPEPVDGQVSHLSQDVVLVIDHSGSMNSPVTAKDENGNDLENGLSIQDIVNHAARTVAKSLDKNSRLGVVIFDNQIVTLFDLMLMTERNCSIALGQISNIKPNGQTNLWHAIEAALKMLNKRDDKTRNGHIMALTDGAPNIKPARGEVETLKRLRKTLNFTSPIYTFGFGYKLERGLLYDLSKYANGGNGHIPDGGMIATVFCNFLGIILSTIVLNLQINITYSEDVNFTEMDPVMGDFAYNIDSTDKSGRSVIVDIGTVQLGQMRNIVMNTDASWMRKPFSYYYTYKIGGQSYKSYNIEVDVSKCELNENIVNIHIARCFAVEMLRKIVNHKTVGENNEATKCYTQIEEYYASRQLFDPLSKGILNNLKDQVKLTLSNNGYYQKWGEFYIDQLSRSMNQQVKPNFKDQACPFGGDVFTDLVDKASDVFDTLTPPEPSLINQTRSVCSSSGTFVSAPAPTRTPTLAAYNNSNTPCFIGECNISMVDGSYKMVKDLVKGDFVRSLLNPYDSNSNVVGARVVCVLQTNIIDGITEIVTFDGGPKGITPWHPTMVGDSWMFPCNLGKSNKVSCSAVYSIILDDYHTCMIDDVWCITLAHGYMMGILDHSYFGTSAVTNDLMKLPGWNNGRVIIDNNCIIRDHITNMICGIKVNDDNHDDNHDDKDRGAYFEIFG